MVSTKRRAARKAEQVTSSPAGAAADGYAVGKGGEGATQAWLKSKGQVSSQQWKYRMRFLCCRKLTEEIPMTADVGSGLWPADNLKCV